MLHSISLYICLFRVVSHLTATAIVFVRLSARFCNIQVQIRTVILIVVCRLHVCTLLEIQKKSFYYQWTSEYMINTGSLTIIWMTVIILKAFVSRKNAGVGWKRTSICWDCPFQPHISIPSEYLLLHKYITYTFCRYIFM